MGSARRNLTAPSDRRFSSRLHALMCESGHTTVTLGREIGVSSQAVGMWRLGKTMPRGAKLQMLARSLGVPASRLFD